MKDNLFILALIMSMTFTQNLLASDRMLSQVGIDSSIEVLTDLYFEPGSHELLLEGVTSNGLIVQCELSIYGNEDTLKKRKRLKAGTNLIISDVNKHSDSSVDLEFKNYEDLENLECVTLVPIRGGDPVEIQTSILDVAEALNSKIKIHLADAEDLQQVEPEEATPQ